jgi:hypothetical protein
VKFLPKQLLAAALLLGLAAGAGAWQGPMQAPPSGNAAAPLNVGSRAQSKTGTLGVGGLGVFGKGFFASGSYSLPANLQLGVNGAVGATAYCDAQGQNCVTSLGKVLEKTVTEEKGRADLNFCGEENKGVRFYSYAGKSTAWCCYLWSGGAVSGGYHDGLDRHLLCDPLSE